MRRSRAKSRPSRAQPAQKTFTTQDFEEALQQVFESLEADHPDQAREWLELIPQRMQRRVEYLYARAAISQLEGDPTSALDDLEEILQRAPDYHLVYAALTDVYVQLDFSRHAWQAAEKFLNLSSDLEEEIASYLRGIIRTAKEYWSDLASQLGVPLKTMTDAAHHSERAQIALNRAKYLDAAHEGEVAIRMIPAWAPPRNNRALALFYQGRVQQAIQESESVLKQSSDNLFALCNLIQCYSLVGERDKATPYVERLSVLLPISQSTAAILHKIVDSLAIYEADELLWEVAASLKPKMIEQLPPTSVYILGVAAAKTGHFSEASRLLKKCSEEDLPVSEQARLLMAEVNKARRGRIPPDSETIQGASYLHFTQVWPHRLADNLFNQLASAKTHERVFMILKNYMQRHPFMFGVMRLMLWHSPEEEARSTAVEALEAMESPAAYHELQRFASSQLGSDQERMQAVLSLNESGQLHPGEPLRFWSSRRNQWIQAAPFLTSIRPVEPPRSHPKAMELVERSSRAQQSAPPDQIPPRAIEYLEQAIQIDPQCSQALHNLGVLYIQQGETDKGESLVRRAIEADPNYLFAYTTLAFQELQRENLEACEEYLKKVFTAPAISEEILFRALLCRVYLEIGRQNPDSAEQALDILKALDFDSPEIQQLETTIFMLRGMSGWQDRWLEDVHRYRRRQLMNPISPEAGLRDCLERISRDALNATLRAWGMSTVGRKKEVIDRLAGVMTDLESMDYALGSTLSQEEKMALRWLLEGVGIRSWNEFTDRFGSDFDESPYWQWHNPETVPGRLRMLGLLAVGSLEDHEVALIPTELRPVLTKFLTEEG